MKKFITITVITSLMLMMSINIFASGGTDITFYVNASAASGGDGSAEHPFAGITEAITAIRTLKGSTQPTGDITVVFGDGTYPISSTVILTSDDSGSPEHPIIYRAADGAEVIFTGAVSSSSGAVSVLSSALVEVRGAEHVVFKEIAFSDNLNAPLIRINANSITVDSCTLSDSGFTKAPADSSDVFALSVDGTSVTVKGCEIYNVCGGVSLNGGNRTTLASSDNVIRDSYLHHMSRVGISVSGVGASVEHNEITDCADYAVYLSGNSHNVSYNCVRRSSDSAIVAEGGLTAFGNEIKYNFVDSADGNGIFLRGGTSGSVVCGNIVRNTFTGIYLDGGRELDVENNVVICDSGVGIDDPVAIYYDSSYRDNVTRNLKNYTAAIAELSNLPYKKGVWAERYPSLAKLSVPVILEGIKDMNSTSLFFNPAGSTLKNNAFYVSGDVKSLRMYVEGETLDGVAYQMRHGLVFNNVLLPRENTTDFPAAEFGNYALKSGAKVFKALPAFQSIPFNRIGIVGVTSKITFKDVMTSAWYYKWVVYSVNEGLMSGTDTWGGSFSPGVTTSRAMIIQMLYNIEGRPDVTYTDHFTDVPEGKWYSKAVTWAYENGITAGSSSTAFSPDLAVTREQLAVFLYRYMRDYRGVDPSTEGDLTGYPDAGKISTYRDFKEALSWAVREGILTGKEKPSGVYLAPKDSAQRCEAAAVFGRFDIWLEK